MRHYLLAILLLSLLTGCVPNLEQYSKTEEHMGTFVSIIAYSGNSTIARTAIDTAFSEIGRIESMLSEYSGTSLLYKLNEQGYIETEERELIALINQSIAYSQATEGAFDITVKPILDLYKKSFEETGNPPSSAEIEEALSLVGSDKVELTSDSIELQPGMGITLGAIAKGYAVDLAGLILEEHGIDNYLINAGGDILAKGSKPQGDWNIALTNPRNKSEYVTMFQVKDQAVATSGDYERYFNEDMTFHHIVDPRTGLSATGLISATVIAPSAMQADAMSTSIFVLGEEEGMGLIESVEGFEAMAILRNRTIIHSEGWK